MSQFVSRWMISRLHVFKVYQWQNLLWVLADPKSLGPMNVMSFVGSFWPTFAWFEIKNKKWGFELSHLLPWKILKSSLKVLKLECEVNNEEIFALSWWPTVWSTCVQISSHSYFLRKSHLISQQYQPAFPLKSMYDLSVFVYFEISSWKTCSSVAFLEQ